jgi:CheY-like chemotaxis protein
MMSHAAPWGPLPHLLERVRRLAGLRRIVVVWQGATGSWRHVIRSREDMLPQAEARLLREVSSVFQSGGRGSPRWKSLLSGWKADAGWFETFQLGEDRAGYYLGLRDADASADQPVLQLDDWLGVLLPALAQSAFETERNSSLAIQRQAVLESAASLSTAEAESDIVEHASALARRLLEADGAAYYQVSLDVDVVTCRHADADLSLRRELLARAPLLPDTIRRAMTEYRPVLAGPDLDVETSPYLADASVVAVPLGHAGSPWALLCVVRTTGLPLSDYDLSTLTLFCRQVESVLENRRLLSKLQEANLELSSTQAQLVESARLQTLGEVASSVAHDFNNVLGALLGRVQLLQHSVSDAGMQKALGKMERMVAEGEATVRRLQEAAHRRRSAEDHEITLDGLVRDTFSNTESVLHNQMQIKDRKIVWMTEFKPTGSPLEQAHKLRGALRQLLTDLSDAVPDDTVIELKTGRRDGADQLAITLVPPPALAGAWDWEPLPGYSQLRAATHQLGGTLSVANPGTGEITLALSIAQPRSHATSAALPKGPYRVLVVDDDVEVREVLQELLQTDGHLVTTAEDGADALKKFHAGTFDIVFTDLGMPGISGWQVAEMIKRDSPTTPVIMVTGWGNQLDPDQIEQSGVDRVLTKPFQWLKVLDALSVLSSDPGGSSARKLPRPL